ncbi:MAG: HIT family protein [Christensenellales bacterium]
MSDKKCMYCDKAEDLLELMLPICEVDGFLLYLFKNQAYHARVVLAYDSHVKLIADMDEKRYAEFFAAMRKTAKAIMAVYNPAQINIGMFSDIADHNHVHIVPKYEGGPDFGGMFQMHPQPAVTLSNDEYQQMIRDIKAALDA